MMEKFKWTIVIPTLWKSEVTMDLLNGLTSCDYVGEILVIDNCPDQRPSITQNSKIKILSQIKNIFVNPAWNLGVNKSKFDMICLCNDDVLFDLDVFRYLDSLKIKRTIFGCHWSNYETDITEKNTKLGHSIGQGWGCILFFSKQYYLPIPDELIIYAGDDWLVDKFKYVKSICFNVRTIMSTTSSIKELNNLAEQDIVNFRNFVSERRIKRIQKLSSTSLDNFLFLKKLRFLYIS